MAKLTLPPFEVFSRERDKAEEYILKLVEKFKKNGKWNWFLEQFAKESTTDPTQAYPSQGLVITDYDEAHAGMMQTSLDPETVQNIIYRWLYYSILLNHPDRLKELFKVTKSEFVPPQPVDNDLFEEKKNWVLGINEIALFPQGSEKERTSRTNRLKSGPFVKLGRQARSVFAGSANPDIWGSVPSIAIMAMSHCLAGVPRDGFFKDIQRQADLVKEVFKWFDKSPVLVGKTPTQKRKLLEHWEKNLMGVIEANPSKAIERAKVLYKAGIRTFRIYSPEPGTGPLLTLKKLRKVEKKEKWQPIEIFVGQVVDIPQAQLLETAGADALYVGIGGGGRCITGVRSGVGINWPQLVWKLRGKVEIPVIVEGGGSDHVAQTLSLGATGIGVTRIAGGGTIESPGGYLYFVDENQNLFKYYRGEASAGMKSMGGRIGPFGAVPYIEGESTRAYMSYGSGDVPTLSQKLYLLTGDVILSLVFQNVKSVEELQAEGAKSLRLVSSSELQMRNTH